MAINQRDSNRETERLRAALVEAAPANMCPIAATVGRAPGERFGAPAADAARVAGDEEDEEEELQQESSGRRSREDVEQEAAKDDKKSDSKNRKCQEVKMPRITKPCHAASAAQKRAGNKAHEQAVLAAASHKSGSGKVSKESACRRATVVSCCVDGTRRDSQLGPCERSDERDLQVELEPGITLHQASSGLKMSKKQRTERKLVTSLLSAASEGKVELVRLLLRCGADVNGQCHELGNTALHQAAWNGFSETVELLCRHRANTSIRNKSQFTPLHMACQQGHNQTARLLLMGNAKTEAKNSYGDTPLHTAARYGHAGVARILLSARSNPNQVNKNHDTPLHIAAAMGRRKLTKIFMQHGAEPAIKNKQNETAMDIALRKDLIDIQELIANPPPAKTSRSSRSSRARRLESPPYGHLFPAGSPYRAAGGRPRISSEEAQSCHRRLEHQMSRLTLCGPHLLDESRAGKELAVDVEGLALPAGGQPERRAARHNRQPRLRTLAGGLSADIHLLLSREQGGHAASASLPCSGPARRLRGGSGSQLELPHALLPDARPATNQLPTMRAPEQEALSAGSQKPAESEACGTALAKDAVKEASEERQSVSPGASFRSSVSKSRGRLVRRRRALLRPAGGARLLVGRPTLGTCMGKLSLLTKSSASSADKARKSALQQEQGETAPGQQEVDQNLEENLASAGTLGGRRMQRLEKMRLEPSQRSPCASVRAINGSRLLATRPLAALTDETQLYAIPKKSKAPAKQQQVAETGADSRKESMRVENDGPALTSHSSSCADSPGTTLDSSASSPGLSLGSEPAPDEANQCRCDFAASEAARHEQMACDEELARARRLEAGSTASNRLRKLFQLGEAKVRAGGASEGAYYAYSPVVRSSSELLAAEEDSPEPRNKRAEEPKKAQKKSFWLRSKLMLGSSTAHSAEERRRTTEKGAKQQLDEPSLVGPERRAELIEIPAAKQLAASRPQLAKDSIAAQLIAAQKSLAAAAAAKVKRDRLMGGLGDLESGQAGGESRNLAGRGLAGPQAVLTVKTDSPDGQQFACASAHSAALQTGAGGQKFIMGGARSGSNSAGMSDSSPSNNGADSDNSLQTTSGSLNTDTSTSGGQPNGSPPGRQSPLGILSRLLLSSKLNGASHKQTLASSSTAGSPSDLAGSQTAAQKLEQLVSRSRRPIVVTRSNEPSSCDEGSPHKTQAPLLPAKSALKPAGSSHVGGGCEPKTEALRSAAGAQQQQQQQINGLPRVSSYTHLADAYRPQQLAVGSHQQHLTSGGAYTAAFLSQAAHFNRAHADYLQQHHLSQHDLVGGVLQQQQQQQQPAGGYDYYCARGEQPIFARHHTSSCQPRVDNAGCPMGGFHDAETCRQQLLGQQHSEDSIYIADVGQTYLGPAPGHEPSTGAMHGRTRDFGQRLDSDAGAPAILGANNDLSRGLVRGLKRLELGQPARLASQRPKSSLDSMLLHSDSHTAAGQPVNLNGQQRHFSANYNATTGGNSSSAILRLDPCALSTNSIALSAHPDSIRLCKMTAGSYITNVPCNSAQQAAATSFPVSSAAYSQQHQRRYSSSTRLAYDTGAITTTTTTATTTTAAATATAPAGAAQADNSYLSYSAAAENSVYASNQSAASFRPGSDLTVLPSSAASKLPAPAAAASEAPEKHLYLAGLRAKLAPKGMARAAEAEAEADSQPAAAKPKSSWTPYKTLVQVKQPAAASNGKSNQSSLSSASSSDRKPGAEKLSPVLFNLHYHSQANKRGRQLVGEPAQEAQPAEGQPASPGEEEEEEEEEEGEEAKEASNKERIAQTGQRQTRQCKPNGSLKIVNGLAEAHLQVGQTKLAANGFARIANLKISSNSKGKLINGVNISNDTIHMSEQHNNDDDYLDKDYCTDSTVI